MAYGGKNTRSSIADQITAAIEADMDIFFISNYRQRFLFRATYYC